MSPELKRAVTKQLLISPRDSAESNRGKNVLRLRRQILIVTAIGTLQLCVSGVPVKLPPRDQTGPLWRALQSAELSRSLSGNRQGKRPWYNAACH